MIKSRDLARLWTRSKLSRWDLFKSLSRVNSVIPIIPFIGVLRNRGEKCYVDEEGIKKEHT